MLRKTMRRLMPAHGASKACELEHSGLALSPPSLVGVRLPSGRHKGGTREACMGEAWGGMGEAWAWGHEASASCTLSRLIFDARGMPRHELRISKAQIRVG